MHVSEGKAGTECVAYAPTQSPGGCRDDLAKLLGIPVENVTVNVTLLGGGFGRKSKWDYVLEAALVSKATGAPIKVVWTREDDIQHDFYHTVSVERIDAGIDANGKVVAWRHRSVAPTIASTFKAGADHEAPFELGMGLVDNPFSIPNLRCENGQCQAHTRIGWFRSVSNIPHGFAVQSMVAEIAAALGRIRRMCCWNCSAPIASSIRASRPRSPTTGTTAIRSRPIRSTPGGCAVSPSSPPIRPGGASRCRRARASASPRIAAS